MKQKVLLIIPPGFNYNTPPIGLLYIGAMLEQHQIPVGILDAGIEKMDLEATYKKVAEINPAIIGISSTTPEYPLVEKFAFLLKKRFPNIPLVLGGPHATLDPNGVIKAPFIDFAVRGEGEYTFTELCQFLLNKENKNLSDIQGISYCSEGKNIHNADRPMTDDLDKLPFPARHLIHHRQYRNYGRVYKQKPVAVMITSRGCPYQCIFCAHDIFGRKYRFVSARKMVDEIKILKQKYGVKEIFFREDNFTANRKRVSEFCDILVKEKVNVSWMCLADANSITEELAYKMKQAGCWHVAIGVESGNQDIQKVLKKNLNLEKVKQVFDSVHKAGLKTLAFFMIGNFADSRKTVMETIRFANSLNTDFATFTITTPFPNTELYDMAVRDNLITKYDIGQITNNPSIFKQKAPVLRTRSLTPEQLRKLQLTAIACFYLRPKQMFRILKNRYLARAFVSVEPASYNPNSSIIRQIEQRYDGECS
ncbi:MAG: radical SAM protein [Desulfobacteraceae bacterium]|nr:radical SAM protein [Desulfobacteraceae bacterium]